MIAITEPVVIAPKMIPQILLMMIQESREITERLRLVASQQEVFTIKTQILMESIKECQSQPLTP